MVFQIYLTYNNNRLDFAKAIVLFEQKTCPEFSPNFLALFDKSFRSSAMLEIRRRDARFAFHGFSPILSFTVQSAAFDAFKRMFLATVTRSGSSKTRQLMFILA